MRILIFFKTIQNPDSFFIVFAIIFPAFTGMTAGVGLSGDLLDPKKAIPLGSLMATFTGMLIYLFIAYKLTISASPEDLASDQLIMGKIALWGPIIALGLAAATFSSALGSIMVAPRTLQALASDEIIPNRRINALLSKETKKGEPFNATVITIMIALFFLLVGDINMVAQIISMFFMVYLRCDLFHFFFAAFCGRSLLSSGFQVPLVCFFIRCSACVFI